MMVNREEMASIIGKSGPTLDEFVRRGCPGRKAGRQWEFDTGKVIEWLINQAKKNSAPSKKGEVELRIAEAEAELKEYKVAETRGLLIAVKDANEALEGRLTTFKSLISAMPGRVAQAVAASNDPAEVLRILKAEVAEALNGMGKHEFTDPDKRKHGYQWDKEDRAGVDDDGATPGEEPRLTDDGY